MLDQTHLNQNDVMTQFDMADMAWGILRERAIDRVDNDLLQALKKIQKIVLELYNQYSLGKYGLIEEDQEDLLDILYEVLKSESVDSNGDYNIKWKNKMPVSFYNTAIREEVSRLVNERPTQSGI